MVLRTDPKLHQHHPFEGPGMDLLQTSLNVLNVLPAICLRTLALTIRTIRQLGSNRNHNKSFIGQNGIPVKVLVKTLSAESVTAFR